MIESDCVIGGEGRWGEEWLIIMNQRFYEHDYSTFFIVLCVRDSLFLPTQSPKHHVSMSHSQTNPLTLPL